MTRALTIMALVGFLIFGAAATSILGRVGVPASQPELASSVMQDPVANRKSKTDKLTVAVLAPAPQAMAPANEPRWLAFASSTADIESPNLSTLPAGPLAPPKPKLAGKPPPQKSYALLSDAQIAGIKERLKLSSAQESYWPAVENALRAVARKIHETRQANPHATGAPIDPDCAEVQQLKSAAMPLLFQLREDQKREVRTLAHLIGLEQVASQI